MKRLTQKHYGANDYYMACSEECERDHCVECAEFEKIVDLLGAYEDTGLTPSEMRSMRMDMSIIRALFQGAEVERLKALAGADKEGRVVVLPCKVGDTMIDLTFPEGPKLMKNIRLGIFYEYGYGIGFHMGYDTFIDLVAHGRIKTRSGRSVKEG